MATTYSNVPRKEREHKAITGAYSVSIGESGTTFVLDAAAGAAITLPALVNGLEYTFVVGAAFATSNWVVSSSEGDNINGIISDMGSTVAGVPASGEDQINFVNSAETVGDWVTFYADADNGQWLVRGACTANGGITATDPA